MTKNPRCYYPVVRFIGLISLIFSLLVPGVYSKTLPLVFEPNRGQFNDEIICLVRHDVQPASILKNGVDIYSSGADAPGHVRPLSMRFHQCREVQEVSFSSYTAGCINYFLGGEPSRWITQVPLCRRVVLHGMYEGIDVAYYEGQGELEYDLIVRAGADPSRIKLSFEGHTELKVAPSGDLALSSFHTLLRKQAPVVFQHYDHQQHVVDAHYVVVDDKYISIELGDYNEEVDLIIDPVLVYSSVLGGHTSDQANAVCVFTNGNHYLSGRTESLDYPVYNALTATNAGGADLFVTCLGPDGTNLLFSTYIGGSLDDECSGMALDEAGDLYLTGSTLSTNFPVTSGAFSEVHAGARDVFVLKLAGDGSSLLFSSYVGGSSDEYGMGIGITDAHTPYVSGYTASSDFPTMNPFQGALSGSRDAFIVQLSADGATQLFGTYFGGTGRDEAYAMTLDSMTNIFMTGTTSSTNLPVASPSGPAGIFQAQSAGGRDVFVSGLDAGTAQLVFSTYLGGVNTDKGLAVAVLSNDMVCVFGETESTNFPVLNAFQSSLNATGLIAVADTFVTCFNAGGSNLHFSTYLGGTGVEEAGGIVVDQASAGIIVVGETRSLNFPSVLPAQNGLAGGSDAFVCWFSDMGQIGYAGCLGGQADDKATCVAVGPKARPCIAGYTASTNFPLVHALSATNYGGNGVFMAEWPGYLKSSVFTNIISSGNAVLCQWSGELGWQYSVEGTEDSLLNSQKWAILGTNNHIPGVSGPMDLSVSLTNGVGTIRLICE